MKIPAFRAVALILLIISLISWSGSATIAAAWMQPETTDACCERSGGEESGPLSCSPNECPCFFCLPFAPAESLAFGHGTTRGLIRALHRHIIPPTEIIRAIDYPPEIS